MIGVRNLKKYDARSSTNSSRWPVSMIQTRSQLQGPKVKGGSPLRSVSSRIARPIRLLSIVLGTFALIILSVAPAGATGLYWGQASTPSPGPAGSIDSLTSVSCVSSNDCWAVGGIESSSSSNVTSLTMNWNGSAWSSVPTPNPGGSGANQGTMLNGVTCVSSNECLAVGAVGTVSSSSSSSSGSLGPDTNLVLQWNGSAWNPLSIQNLGGTGGFNELSGVTCVSSNDCWVVGEFASSTGILPDAFEWNGSTWAQFVVPAPGGLEGALYSISCPNLNDCIAVGLLSSPSNGSIDAYAAQWNGSGWSQLVTPSILNGSAILLSVSCPTSSYCLAVGTEEGGLLSFTPVALQWNGSTWSLAGNPVPGAGGSTYDILDSVSCSSPTACVAVGGYSPSSSSNLNGIVMEWNGGGWSENTTSLPTGDSTLNSTTCLQSSMCWAVGQSSSSSTSGLTLALTGVVPTQGYREVATDGGLFSFGTAQFYGSMGGKQLNEPIVGMASVSGGSGYWEVATDGGLFSFGTASFYGSMGGKHLNAPIVGMAATPDGGGYWEVASDGGIFAFGNAKFYGSMGGKHLNKPIVGIASTADGKGYWEVASDGGIFAFGDAVFHGSMGGKHLNAPIVAITATPDGGGYWEVASDGGLFSFGDAGFHGSMGGRPLNQPIVGMAATPDGGGYWEVASDGGIFAFGDAKFYGSMGGQPLNQPIVAITGE